MIKIKYQNQRWEATATDDLQNTIRISETTNKSYFIKQIQKHLNTTDRLESLRTLLRSMEKQESPTETQWEPPVIDQQPIENQSPPEQSPNPEDPSKRIVLYSSEDTQPLHQMECWDYLGHNLNPVTEDGQTYPSGSLLNFGDRGIFIVQNQFPSGGRIAINSDPEAPVRTLVVLACTKRMFEIYQFVNGVPESHDLESGAIGNSNNIPGHLTHMNLLRFNDQTLRLQDYKHPIFRPVIKLPDYTNDQGVSLPYFEEPKEFSQGTNQEDVKLTIKAITGGEIYCIWVMDCIDQEGPHYWIIAGSPENGLQIHILNYDKPNINDTRRIILDLLDDPTPEELKHYLHHETLESALQTALNIRHGLFSKETYNDSSESTTNV